MSGTHRDLYAVPKVDVLHAKTTDEVWVPWRLVILVQNALFCMQKSQMRAGTHRDRYFRYSSRCFACTKRQVMSGTHRDLYAGPKVAVLHAKTTDEGWDQYRLVLKSLFCMKRTTEESWNPYRLAILVLKSLICMQETTGEGWNPYSLFICIQKPRMRAGTHRD